MLRILLIDDNPQDRLLAIRALEKEFPTLQVQEVVKADDLTLVLETGQFDLVITDYQLRWSDGLSVLHSIKDRYPDCPVIMFTNSGTQEIAVEAMKAGLEDYVIKSPKHYIRLATAVHLAWEKAQTNRKVKGLENRLQGLLNQLNVGVFRQSLDGLLLEGNPAFFRLLGLNDQSDAPTMRSLEPYFQPEDYAQLLNELKAHRQIQEREVQLQRADGNPIWVRLSQTLNTIEGQTIIDGLIEDISDRRQSEREQTRLVEELASKQRLLEAVLQQIPAGLIVAEAPSGRIVLKNEQVQKILHGSYPVTERVEDYTRYQLFSSDARPYAPEQKPLARSVRTGEVVKAEEIDCLCDDGIRRTLLVDSSPIRDAQGGIVAAVVTFYDITERKQAQERIQLYADVVKNAQVGLSVWQLQDLNDPGSFRLLTANPAASELIGIDLEALNGMTLAESFPALLETQILLDYVEVVRTGQAKDLGEVRYSDERVAQGIFSLKAFPLPNHCIGLAFENITQRKQVEEALRDALQKLNFHFENTPLAVIERDRDFRVTRWSKAAERIFGWQAEEVIGQDWQGIFVEDVEAIQNSRARILSGEEKQNICYNRTYTKNGSVVDCEWYNSALFDEAGNFVSVLSLVLDVTDRKQAEAERDRLLKLEQAARSAAESANRLKDEFLAVLSHELRSPLNPILGWVKLLRSRKMDESTQTRALETIERNATLQARLIEDLLDVSRIMRGKTSLNISSVNLASTIEAAIDTVRLSAQAKSIELQSRIDPMVGLISGDPNRLQQVIWNLLSNAIKFTPSGGRVTIRLERKGTQAQIQVSDTGKGINADFLPHVFEYFRQADSSTTRTQGGLGLGLAIVRHLVELHGGTVTASSPGMEQGSTFTVTLPLKIQATAIAPSEPLGSTQKMGETLDNPPAFRGFRILVVDDETDTRDFYTAVLEEHGAEVIAVASADEALEAISRQRPDVLISDIGMPVRDGYSLIRQVRASELQEGGMLPAIALTAYARDVDRQQAIAAGFQKHLAKPVEPNKLVAVVAHLIGQSQGNRAGEAK
ncbi:MAG TPA: PAS domain S-box protein [Candidatus Sericytochromatia bacterium]